MSEKVASVARAINAEMTSNNFVSMDEWLAFKLARAAIEAMREPTEAMERAALKDHGNGWYSREPVKDEWRAMIDEALK